MHEFIIHVLLKNVNESYTLCAELQLLHFFDYTAATTTSILCHYTGQPLLVGTLS